MTLGESFEGVLMAARGGAEWAWAQLYRDVSPIVFGYLRRQRAPSPEDLTGEVFLQVVRDLHRFDGGERDFRSWVLTIAHHRLLDARRALRRRPPPELRSPEMFEPARVDEPAEATALAALGTAAAIDLLDLLTPEQREVLVLRLVADLTVAEVARVVGRREGAVKQLQRRALAALQRHLAAHPYPFADDER